jgi:hypothetical protein
MAAIQEQELEEDEATRSVDFRIKGGQEPELSSRHNREGPTNNTESVPSPPVEAAVAPKEEPDTEEMSRAMVTVHVPAGIPMRMDRKAVALPKRTSGGGSECPPHALPGSSS